MEAERCSERQYLPAGVRGRDGEVKGQDRSAVTFGERGPRLTVDLQHRLHGAHGVVVGPLLHDGVSDGLQLEDNAKHFRVRVVTITSSYWDFER